MKKQDLKHLIRECVQTALNENFLTERKDDPTKEEMVQFLTQQFGRMTDQDSSFRFDVEGAIYWFAANYHGGQWSNLYSALSTSQFRPGAAARGPEPESMEADMYQALEAEYGGKEHQHGTEFDAANRREVDSMTKEPPHPGEDEEALLERQKYEIPCPKCGEAESYIDNPSNPTIYRCSKCDHFWNPDNEKQKKKGPGWSVVAVGYPGMGLNSSPRWAVHKDYGTDYLSKQGEWGRSMFAATFMSREDAQKFADEKLGGQVVKETGAGLDDPNYGDELATDKSLLSVCCGAPPMGSVSYTKDGECSKCGEMTTFSPAAGLHEDGAAAGGQGGPGAPGTGMGNVTANVDPIRTPRAFKHPRNLPAHRKLEEKWLNDVPPSTDDKGIPAHMKAKAGFMDSPSKNEDDEALYVEYVGQMRDEEPFMMGNQKFQYVQAKYPSGKVDIGVYAFAGDLVYGYQAWRQMHNIKESEISDPSTGEVVPGPRDRFENDDSKERNELIAFIKTAYQKLYDQEFGYDLSKADIKDIRRQAKNTAEVVRQRPEVAAVLKKFFAKGMPRNLSVRGPVDVPIPAGLQELVPINEAVPKHILKLKDLLK